MRHDERHAALAAYAFWCKLEQTGKLKEELRYYYKNLFNVDGDKELCPACAIAVRNAYMLAEEICGNCPCEWGVRNCTTVGSPYRVWKSNLTWGYDPNTAAGNVANIMRKWCERVGVIAPRSW